MTVLPLEYTSDKALSYYNRLRAALSSDRDKLALDLLFQSGCTVNELVQIKVSHIEFRKNEICIPAENTKNKTERIVSLPVTLIRRVKSLAANRQADDFLLSTRQSNKPTTRRIEQLLKDASSRAGFSATITPRILRKMRQDILVEQGVAAKSIGKQLGIASLRERPKIAKNTLHKLKNTFVDSKNISPRDSLLFSVIIETACNVSELVKIKNKDIDWISPAINFARIGRVKISESLLKKIRSCSTDSAPDSYIFSTRQSSHMSERRVQQLFRECSKLLASGEITPRTLRFTTAAEMSANTDELKQILGVKKITIYTHGFIKKKT